ncbi:FtsX-like permease family protein [Plantibacter sp. YIM 135347]|uniref:ABC transporter permease n=1 Tax=Plantibacter sp. YIM 135347 TaxID=3423919 RepID=UPI003D33E1D4
MKTFRVRDHRSSLLVATLSSAFGVVLLMVTSSLAVVIEADDVTGSSGTVVIMLAIAAAIFVSIAIYVSAIVTANTFATIVAGRTRTIALLRLIGSSARTQRKSFATEGMVVGMLGGAAGLVFGLLAAAGFTQLGVALGSLPSLDYPLITPTVVLPVAAVVLTTWLASWIGARRVLTVTPMQAIAGSQELSREESTARPGRNATAIVLFSLGVLLLVAGVAVGLVSPFGVLIGIVGGIVSFTGLVIGAHLVMPPALRLVGHWFGSSAPAKLAAENAVRYPERSSRTTIGLVIGVTLITMFAVAAASFQQFIEGARAAQPEVYEGIDTVLNITVGVFSALIGLSALIAAVGMVNNLSLSVLQRTRELGLLRALGFSAKQVRRMILLESAQLTTAAVLVGLVLGIFYGWAGAQSMFGAINGSPGLIVPAVPWLVVGIIVVLAAVLTAAAAVTPSRRATRIAPVAALAVD